MANKWWNIFYLIRSYSPYILGYFGEKCVVFLSLEIMEKKGKKKEDTSFY